MKYRSYHLLLAGIFSLLTTGAMAEKTSDKPYWQDVQVVSVNKEYPRTSFMTYEMCIRDRHKSNINYCYLYYHR